jgi:hypothetical protein
MRKTVRDQNKRKLMNQKMRRKIVMKRETNLQATSRQILMMRMNGSHFQMNHHQKKKRKLKRPRNLK